MANKCFSALVVQDYAGFDDYDGHYVVSIWIAPPQYDGGTTKGQEPLPVHCRGLLEPSES